MTAAEYVRDSSRYIQIHEVPSNIPNPKDSITRSDTVISHSVEIDTKHDLELIQQEFDITNKSISLNRPFCDMILNEYWTAYSLHTLMKVWKEVMRLTSIPAKLSAATIRQAVITWWRNHHICLLHMFVVLMTKSKTNSGSSIQCKSALSFPNSPTSFLYLSTCTLSVRSF